MGFFDRLKRAFGKQNDVKAIESIDNRFESIEQRLPEPTPPQSPPIEQPKPVALSTSISNYREVAQEIVSPEVQKDSYQLGLAAGYTGRSIKEIEGSLSRIEAQMVTKDWLLNEINKIDRRIEDIERALGIIKGALPPMIERSNDASIVKRMPLTQRMEELLGIVKAAGQISFSDLALKMNLDISDIRSMLSIMTKRTDLIERYRFHRTGWVKYVGNDTKPA
jgi:hypothetical protein